MKLKAFLPQKYVMNFKMKELKEQTFQYILMALAVIADIALIINIIHHW